MDEEPFADPYLLSIILAFVIFLIPANLYFIAHFTHHADGSVGGSSAIKFIIVSDLESSIF